MLLIPPDPMEGKDIIMEIRAGTGGDEAALFAADLFRMYSHYADEKGWKIEIISSNETGIGWFQGTDTRRKRQVMSLARFVGESGTHRCPACP